MNFSDFLRSTKGGTSLLVGLGLTTIIVLVSIGVTTVVISSIRESANVTGANQAYYAAEGALEKGLLVNQDKTAGYTAPTETVFSKPPKSSFTISGQVPTSTKYYGTNEYGIPSPGTGNAGENCDSLNPDIKDSFYYDNIKHKIYSTYQPGSSPQNAKDNPCNWSKLKVGETISIPLYYTDASNNLVNIFASSSTFYLNLKTGCTDGSTFCLPTPQFDTTKGDSNYKYAGTIYDDPIVTWQITGQSADGSKTYLFSPYLPPFSTATGWPTATTIFYKSKINSPPSTGILTQSTGGIDLSGCRANIIRFLLGGSAGSGQPCSTTWPVVTKPVLKLSVIHSLDESGGAKIPYMVFQLITDSTIPAPPTDTSQTITAEGYSGTFKQVIEVKNPQEAGLLEYVIQQ